MGGPKEYARRQRPEPSLWTVALGCVVMSMAVGAALHQWERHTETREALLECRAEIDQAGARIDGVNRSLAEISGSLE